KPVRANVAPALIDRFGFGIGRGSGIEFALTEITVFSPNGIRNGAFATNFAIGKQTAEFIHPRLIELLQTPAGRASQVQPVGKHVDGGKGPRINPHANRGGYHAACEILGGAFSRGFSPPLLDDLTKF